jgi:hypothetical protein
MTIGEQMCRICKEVKAPEAFERYTTRKGTVLLRKNCNSCRADDREKRDAEKWGASRFCTVCGGRLSRQYKLAVCRRTPGCLRVSTQQHNFLGSRRSREFPPCAGCGGDWRRASRGEKLCPKCRESRFWCSGFRPGTGHVAPIGVYRPKSQACRACVLLRHAFGRSKERGLPFALTPDYVESIWNDTCPYLGLPLAGGVKTLVRTSPTLDRIIPSTGYVEGNVEVISHLANTMKSGALPGELVTFARAVLHRHASSAEAVVS